MTNYVGANGILFISKFFDSFSYVAANIYFYFHFRNKCCGSDKSISMFSLEELLAHVFLYKHSLCIKILLENLKFQRQ